MEIFKLFGSVFIDNDKANKSLQKTDSKAKTVAKSLGGGIKTAAKFGAGVAAGASVAAGALYGVASKAAETTDRIDKMSQKMGLSREGFQEWDYILSQNGASIDSLQTGFKTLSDRTDELRTGVGKGAEAFERLGLSSEELEGMNQEEIFEATVTALQGVTDETERAALANDLLGRAGQEMAPLLAQGADSVENLKNQSHEMGLVMSDESIDAGVAFTDTMDTLKRSFGQAAAGIGVELMPMFMDMAAWVTEHMPEIKRVFKVAFDIIAGVVRVAVNIIGEYFVPVIQSIYDWVSRNMPTIKAVFKTVFEVIVTVVKLAWTIIKTWWDILVSVYSYIFNTFINVGKLIKQAFDGVVDFIDGIVDSIQGIVDAAREAIDWLKDLFSWESKTGEKDIKTASDTRGLDGIRAEGGPVDAGGTYLVGENGPELFTPGGDGTIIPNHALGGASNINIANMVVREEADIKRIARELFDLQRQQDRGVGYAW
jgi:hypothetical protein